MREKSSGVTTSHIVGYSNESIHWEKLPVPNDKKKTARKSIQNQALTEEEVLEVFLDMEEYKKAIQGQKKSIKDLELKCKHFAKNTQEQQRLTNEIYELMRLNRKATRSRFELFLKLIVRLRNQFTKKGSYTKHNFLQEVVQYLEMTGFEVRKLK